MPGSKENADVEEDSIKVEEQFVAGQAEITTHNNDLVNQRNKALSQISALGRKDDALLWTITPSEVTQKPSGSIWSIIPEYNPDVPLEFIKGNISALNTPQLSISENVLQTNKELATSQYVLYKPFPRSDSLTTPFMNLIDSFTHTEKLILDRYLSVMSGTVEYLLKNFHENRIPGQPVNEVMAQHDALLNTLLSSRQLSGLITHPVIAGQYLMPQAYDDWILEQNIDATNIMLGEFNSINGQKGKIGGEWFLQDNEYKLFAHALALAYRTNQELNAQRVYEMFRTCVPETFSVLTPSPRNLDMAGDWISAPFDETGLNYYSLYQVATKSGISRTINQCQNIINDLATISFSSQQFDSTLQTIGNPDVESAMLRYTSTGSEEMIMSYLLTGYMPNAFMFNLTNEIPNISSPIEAIVVLINLAFEAQLNPIVYSGHLARHFELMFGIAYSQLYPREYLNFCTQHGWSNISTECTPWLNDQLYFENQPHYKTMANLAQYPGLRHMVQCTQINQLSRTNVDHLRAARFPYWNGAVNPVTQISFYRPHASMGINPPMAHQLSARFQAIDAVIQNMNMHQAQKDTVKRMVSSFRGVTMEKAIIFHECVGRQMNALNRSGLWPSPPTELGQSNITAFNVAPRANDQIQRTVPCPQLPSSRSLFTMLGTFLSINATSNGNESIRLTQVLPSYSTNLIQSHIDNSNLGTRCGITTGIVNAIMMDGAFETNPDENDNDTYHWQLGLNDLVDTRRPPNPPELDTFDTEDISTPFDGNKSISYENGPSILFNNLHSSSVIKALVRGADDIVGSSMVDVIEGGRLSFTATDRITVPMISKVDLHNNISVRSPLLYPLCWETAQMLAAARFTAASQGQMQDPTSRGIMITGHRPLFPDPLVTKEGRFPYTSYILDGEVEFPTGQTPKETFPPNGRAKLVYLVNTLQVDKTSYDLEHNQLDGFLIMASGRENLMNTITGPNTLTEFTLYYFDKNLHQDQYDDLTNWVRWEVGDDYWRIITNQPSSLEDKTGQLPIWQAVRNYSSDKDEPGKVTILSTKSEFNYVFTPDMPGIISEQDLKPFMNNPSSYTYDSFNYSFRDVPPTAFSLGTKPIQYIMPFISDSSMNHRYQQEWGKIGYSVTINGNPTPFNRLNESVKYPTLASFEYQAGEDAYTTIYEGITNMNGRIIGPVTLWHKELEVFDYFNVQLMAEAYTQ